LCHDQHFLSPSLRYRYRLRLIGPGPTTLDFQGLNAPAIRQWIACQCTNTLVEGELCDYPKPSSENAIINFLRAVPHGSASGLFAGADGARRVGYVVIGVRNDRGYNRRISEFFSVRIYSAGVTGIHTVALVPIVTTPRGMTSCRQILRRDPTNEQRNRPGACNPVGFITSPMRPTQCRLWGVQVRYPDLGMLVDDDRTQGIATRQTLFSKLCDTSIP
jgi:hypothetical protein